MAELIIPFPKVGVTYSFKEFFNDLWELTKNRQIRENFRMANKLEIERKKNLLLNKLKKNKMFSGIQKYSYTNVLPMSSAQKRIWIHEQMTQVGSLYNVPISYIITGHFDVKLIKRCFAIIIQRHEALRTTFRQKDEEYLQIIHPNLPLNVQIFDLKEQLNDTRKRKIDALIKKAKREIFDLIRGPLFYINLCVINTEEYFLIINMHHIITDGVSIDIMMKEFLYLYTITSKNKPPLFGDLQIQYPDYTLWYRSYLSSDQFQKHLLYWKQELQGLPILKLPTDKPRTSSLGFIGNKISILLPESLSRSMQKICLENNISFFIFLLTVFKVLLYRYSLQNDFAVGVIISGRKYAEVKKLIGNFINVLAFRSKVNDSWSFIEFLKRINNKFIEFDEYQSVPIDYIINEIDRELDPKYTQLFQVLFIMRDFGRNIIPPGLNFKIKYNDITNDVALTDILMSATTLQGRWQISINYNTELFGPIFIKNMLDNYKYILEETTQNVFSSISRLTNLIPIQKLKILLSTSFPLEGIDKIVTKQLDYLSLKNDIMLNEQFINFDNLHDSKFFSVVNGVYVFILQVSDFILAKTNYLISDNEIHNRLTKLISFFGKNNGQVFLIFCPSFCGEEHIEKKLCDIVKKWFNQQKNLSHTITAVLPNEILFLSNHLGFTQENLPLFVGSVLSRSLVNINYLQDKFIFLDLNSILFNQLGNLNVFLNILKHLRNSGIKVFIYCEKDFNISSNLKNNILCNDELENAAFDDVFKLFMLKNSVKSKNIIFISNDEEKCRNITYNYLGAFALHFPNSKTTVNEKLVRNWLFWQPQLFLKTVQQDPICGFVSAFVKKPDFQEKLSNIGDKIELNTLEKGNPKVTSSLQPSNSVEKILLDVWKDVLNLDHIEITDNFLSLGGHSLKATQIISRIRNVFNVSVSVRMLFESQTIANLSKYLIEQNVESIDIETKPQSILRIDRKGFLPLSFSQQRLWFLYLLEPQNAVYNITSGINFYGDVNLEAIQYSLNQIINRHESLRTTFDMINGAPRQKINDFVNLKIPIIDLRDSANTEDQNKKKFILIKKETEKPFLLSGNNSLLRTVFFRLSEEHSFLLLVVHHIIFDGWSFEIFLREFSNFYTNFCENSFNSIEELPIQYVDFAYWQRNCINETIARQLEYWKNKLFGLSPAELSLDHARQSIQTYQGKVEEIIISNKLAKNLKKFSQTYGYTMPGVFLASLIALIYQYTLEKDIAIGTTIANRNRKEIENIIGYFVNVLVIRIQTGGRSLFKSLLDDVKNTTMEAYANQDLPFEKLIEEIGVRRDISLNPLFQVMFNYVNISVQNFNLPNLEITFENIRRDIAKFDIEFTIIENEHKLTCLLEYNTNLFEPDTICQIISCYFQILTNIEQNYNLLLSQLSLIDVQEKKPSAESCFVDKLQEEACQTNFCYSDIDQSIAERFVKQVKKHAEEIAIKTSSFTLTYQQLHDLTNVLAAHLSKIVHTRNNRIALLFEFGHQIILGMLSALKVGGSYIPLDTTYPYERLDHMCTDAKCSIILTNNQNLNLAKRLAKKTQLVININDINFNNTIEYLLPKISPSSIAYILYTSGSTGKPKGVVQSNKNVLYHIYNYTNNLEINLSDRVLQLASFNFDAAIMDIYGALLNGAILYPINIKEINILDLYEYIDNEKITIYHSTPSVYRYLFNNYLGNFKFSNMRFIVLGGEEVFKKDFQSYKKIFPKNCKFVNGLGPTECTLALQNIMDHTYSLQSNKFPIGRPVSGIEAILLDEDGNQTQLFGELAFSGEQIAIEYWRLSKQSKRSFLLHPSDANKRIYRTGDLARLLPDGNFLYVGRKDSQVKIRGHRIEINEIDAKLRLHPLVEDAYVIGKTNEHETYLIAYVVPKKAQTLTDHELREYLLVKLPNYMIPSYFILLEGLPLTPNGKINLAKLPKPQLKKDNVFLPPTTNTEKIVADIWREILSQEEIDIVTNFFDIGGHSLALIAVQLKLYEKIGKKLSIIDFFKYPTIKTLANFLDGYHEKSLISERVKLRTEKQRQVFASRKKRRRK